MQKIAVITGASRGLGFATAKALGKKGYTVLLLGRDLANIQNAAQMLIAEGIDAKPYLVDVAKTQETQNFGQRFATEFPQGLDVLVNNAGRLPESRNEDTSAFGVSEQTILETLNNNTLSASRMIKALAPALKKRPGSCVVNVSSGMGQLSDMNGGYPAYRISKTAMNAVTRIFSEELQDVGVKVNSICPGWVKTDMGGPGAERSIEEGIAGIVWAATLPKDGPTGGFFRDGERIDW